MGKKFATIIRVIFLVSVKLWRSDVCGVPHSFFDAFRR